MNNGVLILGGMPIGNSKDISLRMIEAIKTADVVVAEDKYFFINFCLLNNIKHTAVILQIQYDNTLEYIQNKTLSYLKEGKKVLMVSDCGMPTITDPGREIVQLARLNNILVTSIPGPNVAITSLALSGFPAGNFCYLGYLPKTVEEKRNALLFSKNTHETIIFLEFKKRILETIELINNIFEPETYIFIAINMTMENETLILEKVTNVYEKISNILNTYESVHISVCIYNDTFGHKKSEYWTSLE